LKRRLTLPGKTCRKVKKIPEAENCRKERQ